jgi:hypothetical protein
VFCIAVKALSNPIVKMSSRVTIKREINCPQRLQIDDYVF